MATSGENVTRYTIDTYCTEPVTLLGFDLDCNWAGEVDVYVDSDNSAVFVCGNGHTNNTTWDAIT